MPILSHYKILIYGYKMGTFIMWLTKFKRLHTFMNRGIHFLLFKFSVPMRIYFGIYAKHAALFWLILHITIITLI